MSIKRYFKQKIADYIYSNEVIPHLYERLSSYIDVSMQKNNAAILANVDYLKDKRLHNSKVIYTCLTGGYDSLPLQLYCNKEYDYVCFTDNQALLVNGSYGAWQIRPLKFSDMDDTRNNRWHKLHTHILFPDYEESIYIDSNMQILDKFVFDQITNKKFDIVIPKHNKCSCVYDEIERVLKYVVSKGRETEENVLRMKDFLEKENMPHNYGQTENNFIYRKHNNTKVIKLMEDWWHFIAEYSKRDQLSSSYVFWKNGISLDEICIPNLREEKSHVCFFNHFGH